MKASHGRQPGNLRASSAIASRHALEPSEIPGQRKQLRFGEQERFAAPDVVLGDRLDLLVESLRRRRITAKRVAEPAPVHDQEQVVVCASRDQARHRFERARVTATRVVDRLDV